MMLKNLNGRVGGIRRVYSASARNYYGSLAAQGRMESQQGRNHRERRERNSWNTAAVAAVGLGTGYWAVASVVGEEEPAEVRSTVDVSGIHVPTQVGGLDLAAAGQRTLFLLFPTYVVALYVDTAMARAVMRGAVGSLNDAGAQKLACLRVATGDEVARTVRIYPLRATTADHMANSLCAAMDGAIAALYANFPDAERFPHGHADLVNDFKRLWGKDALDKGACVELRAKPGHVLELLINGRLMGTMQHPALSLSLFENYASPDRTKIPSLATDFAAYVNRL